MEVPVAAAPRPRRPRGDHADRSSGPGARRAFTIALDDVRVTSIHEGASGSDDRPTDAFTLAYGTITWSYRQQRKDGSLEQPTTGSWDLAAGSGG